MGSAASDDALAFRVLLKLIPCGSSLSHGFGSALLRVQFLQPGQGVDFQFAHLPCDAAGSFLCVAQNISVHEA